MWYASNKREEVQDILADLALESICIPVADQERAKQFYVDVLGFALRADEGRDNPSVRLVTVSPPGSRAVLALVPSTSEFPAGSMRGLVIGTNDLTVTYARFRQKSVDIDAPITYFQERFAHFRDSEGNHWVVRERRPLALGAPQQTGAGTRPEKISSMSREEANALIDAYLLGERDDREYIFAQIAGFRPEEEAAVPIVRAIALVGSRAADESLMALRLTLSSRAASDDSVRAVRSALVDLRNGTAGARERYLAAVGVE